MSKTGIKILIADDDLDDVVFIKDLISDAFGKSIALIDHADSYSNTLTHLDKNAYDICFFDYRFGEKSGLDLLRAVKEKGVRVPIIFLTGQGDQQVAVEAMKSGAMDYLDKAKLSQDILAQSIRHGMELFRKEEERREAQEALVRMTRQNEMILNSAAEGIFGMDPEGKITFINPTAARSLGYEIQELIGKNSHSVMHHTRPDGSPYPEAECPVFSTLNNGTCYREMDDVFWRKDGTSFHVEYMSAPIMDFGKILGAVTTFRDITERRKAEETIRNMAFHDALTGLPNRVLLDDRLNVALVNAHRYKQMLAVLFLDMDKFKPINDNLGHAVGDLVLQELANRLKHCLREGDTVARLGGDEFIILFPQIMHISDAELAAQKILDAVKQPFLLAGHSLDLTASIGVAIYPKDGQDRDTLLKKADQALYRAKDSQRNNFQLYSSI